MNEAFSLVERRARFEKVLSLCKAHCNFRIRWYNSAFRRTVAGPTTHIYRAGRFWVDIIEQFEYAGWVLRTQVE